MKHIGQFLYDKLTIDKRYIEYCNKYLEYKKIDSNILNKLLNDYKDLYYIFLKSFIYLYFKTDIKNLSKELQNYQYNQYHYQKQHYYP